MRREAHCTYRAMRLLLFGGEQKETAMPFPTSKCGRPGEGRFGPGGVVLVDEGTRACGERSTTPDWWKTGSCLGAWCPSTKGQGFAGREAPRRIGGRPVRAWGRGARRRRNKGLRGEKHHAEPPELTFGPGGVVPVDEGTRACGERSTTPSRRNSRLSLRAWCPEPRKALIFRFRCIKS